VFSWREEFQQQVTARSPRLAGCFAQTTRPGTVRWSAQLQPKTGSVSDHTFEELGTSGTLTKGQQECLVEVLSRPYYQLTPAPSNPSGSNDSPPDTMTRISMVLEF
jgi:hypothetical protein